MTPTHPKITGPAGKGGWELTLCPPAPISMSPASWSQIYMWLDLWGLGVLARLAVPAGPSEGLPHQVPTAHYPHPLSDSNSAPPLPSALCRAAKTSVPPASRVLGRQLKATASSKGQGYPAQGPRASEADKTQTSLSALWASVFPL